MQGHQGSKHHADVQWRDQADRLRLRQAALHPAEPEPERSEVDEGNSLLDGPGGHHGDRSRQEVRHLVGQRSNLNRIMYHKEF